MSIAIDPANPQVVYAGSYGSGVYKSIDGGNSWSSISQGLTNLFVYSLAIDPFQPSIVYAGTYRSQIYKTTNGGQSWSWSGIGMQDQAIVYSIAIDPVSSNVIYAATRGISNNGNPPWNGVVYKSTDSGLTWISCLSNLGGPSLQDWVYSITVNRNAHQVVLIAAHESGPYRSDDFGSHWYTIDSGLNDVTGFSGRSIVVSQQPQSIETYYYGVWHVDSMYKTTSGGSSWKLINQGIPNQHVYSIALDPQNINNVYLATFTSGILKSTNGGILWQPSSLPLDDIYTLAINPSVTSHLLAGTAGDGAFRSEDSGQTWDHSNTGINNAMVTSAVISPVYPDRIYASLYGGGIYQSVNQGDTWDTFTNGLTDLFVHDLVMDPGNPTVLYALTDVGGLFRNDLSTANGWINTGSGLPLMTTIKPAYLPDSPFATLDMQEAFAEKSTSAYNAPAVYAPLMKMVFSPSDPQIAYLGTGGSGVSRSSNGGQSWQSAGLSSQSISSLAVDLMNSSLVYVYTTTDTSGSFMVSTNGGQNWTSVGFPGPIFSLAASPVASGILYGGTNNGIFRYQNGTWTELGLSGMVVTAVRLNPAHPGLIYAGTENGAYYSLNDGQTWNFANENLSEQTIESIAIDPNNPALAYFSTKTHGIFMLAI